jgi:RNA polymerase sigma-70 factor (ECF subfamily)
LIAVSDADLSLVEALQNGDDAALDELMGRHKRPLYSFIYRYVLNAEDAEELTQEAFVRVYLNIRSFKPNAKFVTWLYTIAANLCRDHARSKSHKEAGQTRSIYEGEKPLELPSNQAAPDQTAVTHETLDDVRKAIDALPHDLKVPLILTALDGLSQIEAGERLGISPKAVEARVYRARRRLEKVLKVS